MIFYYFENPNLEASFPEVEYSRMPVTVAHSPIEVNLNVLIDASGNLEVFNATKPVVANVIVAEHALPATALYNANLNKGLLELWEPSDAQGDIKVQLANTNQTAEGGLDMTGAYQTFSKTLAAGLEEVLCDKFDCSGASPFLNYTGNVEYYKQRDFGRIALSTYAHYMFGHVDATAAITNDKAFVQGMLSINAAGDDESAGGAAARAAAFTKSTTANVQAWDNASSGVDANLALRLVKAIVGKGLDVAGAPITSLVSANDSASLANIIAQVVGQDASRLMNADMSQRTRDQHIALRFYAGDVIYMNIKLKAPSVNVGAKNQLVSGATLESMYSEENFTMKITLAAPTQEAVTSYLTESITNITASPTPAEVAELKTYLAGFTASSPAPVATITVPSVPITSLVTTAASSFDTNATYEVNFVLLTDNTATITTTSLIENSVLYLPTTSGTPITLVADSISYTITTSGNSIVVNGTTYTLGQKVVIGNKTFVVAFTGSVGLMVSNLVPRTFTNVIPDRLPNGSVPVQVNGFQYFKFQFTAPSSSINVFAKTDAFAASEELIMGLYASGSTTNLLTTPTNMTVISGATPNSTNGTIAFASNLDNVSTTPNLTLNSLVPGNAYSFITRTPFNDTGADIGLSFENNSTNILIAYVDQSIPPTTTPTTTGSRVFTNVIPDVAPDGSTGILGQVVRYFKFQFTAPSSSINVFAKTDGWAASEELILGLYAPGSTTNSLTTPTSITAGTGTNYNSSAGSIGFVSNLNNVGATPNLTLNSLVPGNVYLFITKTTYNDPGADIGLSFENNSITIPITYMEQSTSAGGILPGFVGHIYTNVVPNVAPDGSALPTNVSETRYFKFNFTAPSSGINVFAKTNQFTLNEEIIQGLYEAGSTTNMLTTPTNITAGTGVTYNSTAGTVKLAGSLDNTVATPNLTFNSLVAGNVYSLIIKTTFNQSSADVSLSFENNAVNIPITYVEQSTSVGIIPGMVGHIFTNVVPDVAPDGSALPTNVFATRYFKYNFTAPSSDINVFARTNQNAFHDTIQGLYEAGSTTNSLTTPTTITAGTGVTHDSTAGTILFATNLENTVATPNFTFNSLVAGTVYSFIVKTTFNTAGEDIGLSLENNAVNIPITYVEQSTSVGIIPGMVDHIYTNVVPDVAPDGSALPLNTTAKRYYKYNFTAPSSGINVFTRTNFNALNEEIIQGLYEAGSTTNILKTSASITAGTGVTHNSTDGTIQLASNLENTVPTPNLTFNSLVAGNVYSLIIQSIFNQPDADVALSLENNAVNIPITYVEQSTSVGIIPGAVVHIYTNIIPEVAPDGSSLPLWTPEIRYFKFDFTAPNSSINVFAKTGPLSSNNKIVGLYASGSATNHLTNPTNITAGTGVTYTSSDGVIGFASKLENIEITPNLTFNSLVAGTVYSFITRTGYNGGSNDDIAISFEDNTTNIPITYMEQSTSTTIIPVAGSNTRVYTNVIPDVAPDGSSIPLEFNTRYFKYNFTAPSNGSSINVFAKTNPFADSWDIVLGLYKEGTTTNILTNPTNITTVEGVIYNSTAGTIAFNSELDNVGTTPNIMINSLEAGALYSLITQTTYNAVGADIAFAFETNTISIPLTYVAISETTDIIPS